MQRRAADAVLARLEKLGIDTVFGIPGGTICPFFDALHDSGVALVGNQQETMAVHMAAGWSRATGKVGVVWVTSGPGVLSAVAGIAAALADEVPLLVICGDVAREVAGRGPLQDGGPEGINVVEVLGPVAKRVSRVSVSSRLAPEVEVALKLAATHPRGPCVVSVPLDLGSGPRGRASVHVLPRTLGELGSSLLASIVGAWSAARRPAIVAGIGARRSECGRSLLRIAERTGTPVFLDLEARGLIDERNPLFGGVLGGGAPLPAYLVQGADFILTVGARLDDTTTQGFAPELRPADGTVIQLDHDEARLCRGYDPDVAVCCDLGRAMEQLADVLVRHPLVAKERGANTGGPIPGQLDLQMGTTAPFRPDAVVCEVARVFPDAAFVSDIGNHLLYASCGLTLSDPDGFTVSNGLGGMGSGIGITCGMALGSRTRTVVGFCGDGGMLMHGAELATCVAHQIPAVFIVFDDGSRTQGRRTSGLRTAHEGRPRRCLGDGAPHRWSVAPGRPPQGENGRAQSRPAGARHRRPPYREHGLGDVQSGAR